MISHKHKFIFIHIPKTAGSSIRFYMRGRYDTLHVPHHSTAEQIKSKHMDIFESYTKFCVVRNPWDREVSRYRFIKRNKAHEQYEHTLNGIKWFIQQTGKPYTYYTHVSDVCVMDHILRFENIQSDFREICNRLNISAKRLPHMQRSVHKHYTEYYDDDTRKIVAEKYARDIEYFGYNFKK